MSEDSHSTPITRRHWRRWVLGILLLILIAWFSQYAWLRITYKPQPRDEYWLDKINALDPAPATAVSFSDAEVLLYDAPWLDSSGRRKPGLPWNLDAPLDGPWDRSRGAVDAMCRYFESGNFDKYRNRLIDLASKGLAQQDFYDYTDDEPIREWLYLLTVHARWTFENYDLATTREDWLLVLRFGRQLRRQRFYKGDFLCSLSESLVAREMIEAARSGVPIPGGVRNLADEVHAIIGEDFIFTNIVSRFNLMEKLETDRRYVRHGNGWIDIPTISVPFPTAKDRIWNLVSFVFHDYKQACELTDTLYGTVRSYRTLAEYENNKSQLGKMGQSTLDGSGSLYGLAWRSIRSSCESRMELEAAITMLAIREFEQDHGRIPDTLDALVSDYCPLPVDCACGGTLKYIPSDNCYFLKSVWTPKYAQNDDCYILYSYWLDGDDDGGIDVDEIPEESGKGGDKVFTIIQRQEDTYDELVPERN